LKPMGDSGTYLQGVTRRHTGRSAAPRP
jgi:hypothetical protein